MDLQKGITRAPDGVEGIVWNVLGHTYTPKLRCDTAFLWHAVIPPGTFVPPHIHHTQDEWINVLSGELDMEFGAEKLKAGPGDTVRMPMGIPHGLFNRSDTDVTAMFGVAPTRRLFELFHAIHNVPDPAEVVRISAEHEIEFLPPPES